VGEVIALRENLTQRRAIAETDAGAEHDVLERYYSDAVDQWVAYVRRVTREGAPEFEVRIEDSRAAVARSLAEANRVGSLLNNLLPLRRLGEWIQIYRSLANARHRQRFREQELREFREVTAAPLRQWRARLIRHREDRESSICERLRIVDSQLGCVVGLMDGGELGGAAAELEVIEKLSALPNGWVVLSDVQLVAERWFYYNEQHLKSAQIDHVVVGPGGVWIIETKNWSGAFVKRGDFFDPYEQVGRASFLCHRVLKEVDLPSKTRQVIATRTRLPAKTGKSFAKVLPPEGLCGYLTWFGAEIEPAEISQIATLLAKYVARD